MFKYCFYDGQQISLQIGPLMKYTLRLVLYKVNYDPIIPIEQDTFLSKLIFLFVPHIVRLLLEELCVH